MITNAESMTKVNGQYVKAETFYGLSTDSKPTTTGNGSCYIEIDTGKKYYFDAEGSAWNEV